MTVVTAGRSFLYSDFASSVENQSSSSAVDVQTGRTQKICDIFLNKSLSPLSATLMSKGDNNDTSICSSPFQPFAKEGFRNVRSQDYFSKVQLFRSCSSSQHSNACICMPCRLASLNNVQQICSRQARGFSALPSTSKNIKAFGFARTCLCQYQYLYTGVRSGDGTSSRISDALASLNHWHHWFTCFRDG